MSEREYWQDRIDKSYAQGPDVFESEMDDMIADIYLSDGLSRWEKDSLINLIMDRA